MNTARLAVCTIQAGVGSGKIDNPESRLYHHTGIVVGEADTVFHNTRLGGY
jgi:hypothetical protein